jgi:hypothetical protein
MLYQVKLINTYYLSGYGFWGDEHKENRSVVVKMLVEASNKDEVSDIVYAEKSLPSFDDMEIKELDSKKGIIMMNYEEFSEAF